MANKQVKMTKKEIIDKIIESVEYLILPTTGLLAIWNVNAGVYVAGIAGFIVSGLKLVELFIKEK